MKILKLALPAIFGLVILLTGCAKDEGVCVSSTGKVISVDRSNQPFHSVVVYDNINLILTQDTSKYLITVEAGENLIDGITTVLDSGKLVLRNENSCNWLRSFEVPVNVYLTFSQLDTIVFRAAGNITCTNDWTNRSVYLDVVEGAGKLDLSLNVYDTYIIVRYGTTYLDITGKSEVATLISYGFGPLHAENLNSKFTYVSCYSPNDMFVYSSIDLIVEIGNIGNVYYRGNPANITTNYLNEGRLIRLD